jgi:hypothetical protein
VAKLNGHNNRAGEVIESVLAACARRVNAEPRRGYLGMSSIGNHCARKLWLEWSGVARPGIDGGLARIFANGKAVEERVVEDLIAAGFPVEGRQLEFSDFDGRFLGHCDGIIHGVTKEPHVLEIKSANNDSFKRFEQHGLASVPAYAGQVQCYMGYAGLKRALFVVENKNNQQLYMERVHFDPRVFEALRAKAWMILESGPEGPPPAPTGWCERCGYRYLRCPA